MAIFNDQSLRIVIKAKDEASKVFNNLEKKLKKSGEGMKSAGKSLSVGLTAPLIALGTASVMAAGNFEKSLGDLSTLVGKGTDSMATFEKGLKDVMKRVPKSGDELGAAAYQIVSAGISDASEALMVLEQSGRLAVAGLGETSEAADLMTSAINAFGLEASKSNEIADVIFKTVKNGKTTVAELAQSFGMVAPVAAEMGVSFEELQAATAALTTSGLKTSVAQQQIRAAMSSLLKPTKEAIELFDVLGVKSFKQLIKESGGMVGAFKKLKEATAGDEMLLAKAAGSVEGLGAILALTGNQADAFTTTMKDIKEGANAVDEAFLAQKETFNALWQDMKNKLNVAMIELGTAIMPTVKDIMEQVAKVAGKLATWFGELSPKTQKYVLIGIALGVALGPVLFILGQIVLIAPAVGAAFTLMLGPVGLIIIALAAIVYSIITVIKHWDMIKEITGEVIENMKGKMQAFAKFFINIWEKIKQTTNDIWSGIKKTISSTIDYITRKIQSIINAYNRMKSIVSRPIKAAGSFISGAASKIGGALGFEHGGRVPGPKGQPVPIMAHGQEQVIPANQSRGGGSNLNLTINNPQFRNEDDEERMKRMLDTYFRPLLVNHKISA